MSGHKCCFHSLVIPGIMGCCGCDASLMPGITWEVTEKTHGFSESRAAQMRANALVNLGRVMEGAKALTEPRESLTTCTWFRCKRLTSSGGLCNPCWDSVSGPRHPTLIIHPSINGR